VEVCSEKVVIEEESQPSLKERFTSWRSQKWSLLSLLQYDPIFSLVHLASFILIFFCVLMNGLWIWWIPMWNCVCVFCMNT
jgi:hypothetical protein